MNINKRFAILVFTTMGLILNANTFTLKAMNNQNQINYIDDEGQSYVPLESYQASNLFNVCIANNMSVYRLPDNKLVFNDLSELQCNNKIIKATSDSYIVPLHPIFRSVFDYVNANGSIETKNPLSEEGVSILGKGNQILWYNINRERATFTNEDKSADGYIKVLPSKISMYLSKDNINYYMNMVKQHDKTACQLPIQRFLSLNTDRFCKIPLTPSEFFIANSMASKFICLSNLDGRVYVKSIQDFNNLKNNENWICTFENTDFNNLFDADDAIKSSSLYAAGISQNNGENKVNNNSLFRYLWNCNIF